jgi:uncharacterized membrane-anchored protein YitT (DUF2179 family)
MMKRHHVIRRIGFFERYALISLGIIIMVAGFYFFLIPLNLPAGGVTGFGIALEKLIDIRISYLVFSVNILLLFLGLAVLGKKLFLRSIYGSLLFPTVLFLMEKYVTQFDIQNDYFIGAIFGGAMVGIGFGLMLKYGGTSGGTDIPVKILHQKFNLPISLGVYLFDGFVVLFGTWVFIDENGILASLYALLAIFISGKLADMVVIGGNDKKAMQIITERPQEIKQAIFDTVGRGVTLMNIKGGYTNQERIMLVTVITKQEYYIVRDIIAKLDDNAFVYVTPATEIHGDFVIEEVE